MTTFWARMLIFKAWEKGEITEECAKYFDQLIEGAYIRKIENNIVGITDTYNADTKFPGCVLQKLTEGSAYFGVIKYINNASYKNGLTKDNGTAYLANIVGEEYKALLRLCKERIEEPLAKNMDEFLTIYEYLKNINDSCFESKHQKNDVLNSLSQKIQNLCKEKTISYELQNGHKNTESYKKPAYTDLLDADY